MRRRAFENCFQRRVNDDFLLGSKRRSHNQSPSGEREAF
jgi:hypothetical protein